MFPGIVDRSCHDYDSDSSAPPIDLIDQVMDPTTKSTPIKVDGSTTLPFTTTHKYRIESCTAMAHEMKKYIVGPMPAELFLNENFPTDKIPGFGKAAASQFEVGCYDDTVRAESEPQAYEPFVSPSKEFCIFFSQLSLLLRTRHRGSTLITSNLLIRLHSLIVIRGQVSHSRSNPTSLSTQTPLTTT